MMTITIRYPILFLYRITNLLDSLFERANYTEIGFTGYVSAIDKSVADEYKLKPLTRFEQWLLEPLIKIERKWRRESFRQAVIDVTGEDPGTDWS